AAAALAFPDPPVYPDKASLLVYREGGNEHPIKKAADWARRRAHILANMQRVMGPLPDAAAKVPLDMRGAELIDPPEKPLKPYIPSRVTFAVAKGERVPGYLLIPRERKGKLPAVLCLHQTNSKLGAREPAGLGGSPNLHYAAHLAARGYVTLAPDC